MVSLKLKTIAAGEQLNPQLNQLLCIPSFFCKLAMSTPKGCFSPTEDLPELLKMPCLLLKFSLVGLMTSPWRGIANTWLAASFANLKQSGDQSEQSWPFGRVALKKQELKHIVSEIRGQELFQDEKICVFVHNKACKLILVDLEHKMMNLSKSAWYGLFKGSLICFD